MMELSMLINMTPDVTIRICSGDELADTSGERNSMACNIGKKRIRDRIMPVPDRIRACFNRTNGIKERGEPIAFRMANSFLRSSTWTDKIRLRIATRTMAPMNATV